MWKWTKLYLSDLENDLLRVLEPFDQIRLSQFISTILEKPGFPQGIDFNIPGFSRGTKLNSLITVTRKPHCGN